MKGQRETGIAMHKDADRETEKQTEIEIAMHKDSDRETERQRDKKTAKQRQILRD